MSKKKRHKTQKRSNTVPRLRIPMATEAVVDIEKIKKEATADAVKILEEKIRLTNEERERIRKEAYDKAVVDANKFFLLNGCKALKNKYGFGYVRLERFIDETMRVAQEDDIVETQKWLAKVGFTFNTAAEQGENK